MPIPVLIHIVLPSAAAFERLIAQPVGPLVIAVVVGQGMMIVFCGVDKIHEFLHRIPILIHNLCIAKLLPYHPWHYHSGISPSQARHIGGESSILCIRSHAGIAAGSFLSVAHIAHPFMEEIACIGKIGSGLGKDLCVGCPSKTLISLRTIGRYRQIVGSHPPESVAYELIDKRVAGGEGAGLKIF